MVAHPGLVVIACCTCISCYSLGLGSVVIVSKQLSDQCHTDFICGSNPPFVMRFWMCFDQQGEDHVAKLFCWSHELTFLCLDMLFV